MADADANPHNYELDVVESLPGRSARRDLFRYVTSELAVEYLAIMRLFGSTLLTELSAAEVREHLATTGLDLTLDEAEARCRQLEQWGNLVRSVRDAHVTTVNEWLRSRSRYQVSKLGGRVQRDVDAILHASDGAREVARELLGSTVEVLERILVRVQEIETTDLDALAGDVTTVFNNQRLFTDSAADFYAFVQTRVSRYDLGVPEYNAFKEMLLSYVDLLNADVSRYAPAAASLLEQIEPHLDVLTWALSSMPGLALPDGTAAERSPGRSREEWETLTAWYTGSRGRSGPALLRAAAQQALAQLLANARRMLASAGTGISRRADLLRLASWFIEADTAGAHRLCDAAFGAYPSRHLLCGPEEEDVRARVTTSWWDSDPVDVPMSLRERGDRSARGRSSRVPDPGPDRVRLLAQAEVENARRRAAAAELASIGDLRGARISPAARDMLLERLADLLAINQKLDGPVESVDTDLGLVLRAEPSEEFTVIRSDDGTLTIDGLVLRTSSQSPGAQGADEAAQ